MARLFVLSINGSLDLVPKLPGDDGFVYAGPDVLVVGDLAYVDRVGKDAVKILGREWFAAVGDVACTGPTLGGVALSVE